MEVPFHWSMVAYYAYANIASLKGAIRAYTFGSSSDPEDVKTDRMIGGTLTYITVWNMAVQQIYFTMCCRDHLLSGSGKQREPFKNIRQFLLRSILFPTALVVSMIYWYEYWRSPTLIFGDLLSQVYPPWLDHVMHTFIVPIAFVEMYLCSTGEATVATGDEGGGSSRVKGWFICNAFITIYISVVIVARVIRGIWPYPFLDPNNDGSPLLFFIYLYVAGGFWYYVGQQIYHHFWRGNIDVRRKINQQ